MSQILRMKRIEIIIKSLFETFVLFVKFEVIFKILK